MLLRFAVSNHLSIKETQELSFIKSALKGPEDGLLSTQALPKDKVLPAAIIYGPNASGKSNILDALEFMRHAMKSSHTSWPPESGVPTKPFLLDSAYQEEPSRYEIDFVLSGIRYSYGFACTSKKFVEEWLYAAPNRRQKMLFEMLPSGEMKFGADFTGPKQAIFQLKRENSLFLSVCAQNNHFISKEILNFTNHIIFHNFIETRSAMIERIYNTLNIDERVINFLNKSGTGICSFRKMDKPIVSGDLQSDAEKYAKFQFGHKSDGGDEVFFDSAQESAGTRRLFPLLSGVFATLDAGTIFVIDEIDASLHTQVCDAIIALFTNSATNPNGAQIIATTHDTNLLNARNLRRDELWLVEKSPGGASEFYSLADVKVRDSGNYERGYLQGRYGAIPFAGSATNLIKSL